MFVPMFTVATDGLTELENKLHLQFKYFLCCGILFPKRENQMYKKIYINKCIISERLKSKSQKMKTQKKKINACI